MDHEVAHEVARLAQRYFRAWDDYVEDPMSFVTQKELDKVNRLLHETLEIYAEEQGEW
jgi:hypothetical protein